jgi:transposase
MEVLWLKSHGLPHQQIADLAGVSLRTAQRYLAEYLRGGLKQVRRCKWRGPKTSLLLHERSIEGYFWDHPPRSTKEAARVIFLQTGVRRGLTQVRAFLKAHLGLRYRKVSAAPARRPPHTDDRHSGRAAEAQHQQTWAETKEFQHRAVRTDFRRPTSRRRIHRVERCSWQEQTIARRGAALAEQHRRERP